MKLLLVLITLLFISSVTFCQSFGDRFIASLINESNADSYINPQELKLSKRFGVSYEGIKEKFFIAYDIDEAVKQKVKDGFLKYSIKQENAGFGSKIAFSVPGYTRTFYFIDTQLVSPVKFNSNGWKEKESEYFRFYISQPELFNDYSAARLDEFVKNTIDLLGYTEEEKKLLKENKIYYFLCRDENEIERLTGYKAKGNYILSCDYIVTTYNCHYHEIVHLLVNNKLKNIPLFTHPFMQEGIAVALGGRGGYEPAVMLNLGKFIQASGFADYKEYLSYNNYKNNDASFTYPLSGLYNLFLLKQQDGMTDYYKLYRKYSAGNELIQNSEINVTELPSEELWKTFTSAYTAPAIIPGFEEEKKEVVYNNDSLVIYKDSKNIYIKTAGDILISSTNKLKEYKSKLFAEEYPGKRYSGEKYLFKVKAEEVSLYNLYTNNLIANYAAGFSMDMKPVPKEDGFYKFTVPLMLLEDNLKECSIRLAR